MYTLFLHLIVVSNMLTLHFVVSSTLHTKGYNLMGDLDINHFKDVDVAEQNFLSVLEVTNAVKINQLFSLLTNIVATC